MADVSRDGDRLLFGPSLALSFQRTLRVPDDGRSYPLPPTCGRFPVCPVKRFADRLPADWSGADFFVPMYQREAMWLALDGAPWKPTAVKIGVGGVNAVSGEEWAPTMVTGPQDYVVCPPQLWVDGVNAGDGQVRQFVATPLGSGRTIEAQLHGADAVAGVQLAVFEAKPGRFPDEPPEDEGDGSELPFAVEQLGIGAGGFITQKIYADPYGVDTWQPAPSAGAVVHLLNSVQYRDVTGLDPPPSPVDAEAYLAAGLPWFEVYDEGAPHVPPSEALGGLAGA
jgi:hypothetical protein